jgi:hypothetical protein
MDFKGIMVGGLAMLATGEKMKEYPRLAMDDDTEKVYVAAPHGPVYVYSITILLPHS